MTSIRLMDDSFIHLGRGQTFPLRPEPADNAKCRLSNFPCFVSRINRSPVSLKLARHKHLPIHMGEQVCVCMRESMFSEEQWRLSQIEVVQLKFDNRRIKNTVYIGVTIIDSEAH